jgi:hypothetical protein
VKQWDPLPDDGQFQAYTLALGRMSKCWGTARNRDHAADISAEIAAPAGRRGLGHRPQPATLGSRRLMWQQLLERIGVPAMGASHKYHDSSTLAAKTPRT